MAKKKRERSEVLNNNSKKQKQDEISEVSNNNQNLEIETGLTEDEIINDSEIVPAKLKPRKAQE